jgi:hypothetical protein
MISRTIFCPAQACVIRLARTAPMPAGPLEPYLEGLRKAGVPEE